MRIAATQYSLSELAFDVFFSGCSFPHCPDCQNPELQKFDYSIPNGDYRWVIDSIGKSEGMIEKVRLMGGEPLDQDMLYLDDFLFDLKDKPWWPGKELWVFTKYLPRELSSIQRRLLEDHADFVKHGRYIKELPSAICSGTGITLASANQFIQRWGGGANACPE